MNVSNQKCKIEFKVSFQAANTLMTLANAKTKSQVRAIKTVLRLNLARAKKANGADDKIVRQMKRVLKQVEEKEKALIKEEQIIQQQRLAAAAKNTREEEKNKDELEKKQRVRRGKDLAAIGKELPLSKGDATQEAGKENKQVEGSKFDAVCDSYSPSVSSEPVTIGCTIDLSL